MSTLTAVKLGTLFVVIEYFGFVFLHLYLVGLLLSRVTKHHQLSRKLGASVSKKPIHQAGNINFSLAQVNSKILSWRTQSFLSIKRLIDYKSIITLSTVNDPCKITARNSTWHKKFHCSNCILYPIHKNENTIQSLVHLCHIKYK